MSNPIKNLEGAAFLIDQETWEVQLSSNENATPAYGAVEWIIPGHLTPANAETLSIDFMAELGGIGGGSPRVSLAIEAATIHVVLGPPGSFEQDVGDWQPSGNLFDASVMEGRFDLSQFGGPNLGNWQDVLDSHGESIITGIFGVADAGWKYPGMGQRVKLRNAVIEGGEALVEPPVEPPASAAPMPFPTFASLVPNTTYLFSLRNGFEFEGMYMGANDDGTLSVLRGAGQIGRVSPAQVMVVWDRIA